MAFRRKGTIPFPEMLILTAANENDSTVFKRECAGSLNDREVYADKIYSDIPFYKETLESKKLSVLTPVKAIKGESLEIAQREKAGSGVDKIVSGWQSLGWPRPTVAEETRPDYVVLTMQLGKNPDKKTTLENDTRKQHKKAQ